MNSAERWAPVADAEGRYEVSDLGRVRSLVEKAPRILQRNVGSKGYGTVLIYGHTRRQRRSVHQLVAEAFIGPRPPGMDVCHKNGIKADCRASNLYFGTRSENMLDAVSHGANVNANKTHCTVCGTPYDAANTYIRPDGGRECRCCSRRRNREYEARTGPRKRVRVKVKVTA